MTDARFRSFKAMKTALRSASVSLLSMADAFGLRRYTADRGRHPQTRALLKGCRQAKDALSRGHDEFYSSIWGVGCSGRPPALRFRRTIAGSRQARVDLSRYCRKFAISRPSASCVG